MVVGRRSEKLRVYKLGGLGSCFCGAWGALLHAREEAGWPLFIEAHFCSLPLLFT
jgi:hypothetical protein